MVNILGFVEWLGRCRFVLVDLSSSICLRRCCSSSSCLRRFVAVDFSFIDVLLHRILICPVVSILGFAVWLCRCRFFLGDFSPSFVSRPFVLRPLFSVVLSSSISFGDCSLSISFPSYSDMPCGEHIGLCSVFVSLSKLL